MGSFLISCAATLPQQTYLNNTTLSGIKKVAIVVSVSAPEVSYRDSGYAWFPWKSPAWEIETIIRYGLDSQHTSKINEHVDISQIENKTAQSFIQQLKKGAFFQRVEYMPNKNQDSSQLTSIGYDAVIRLTVREITIQRAPGDYVRLAARVHGEMERLNSGNIVWDREELVTNPEPHSLGYYEENGLRELDAMLEKAGRNLAYDFLYLK